MIQYTMEDLTQEVKDKILDELHKSFEWKKLKDKLANAVNSRNYLKIQQMQQVMRQKEIDVVYEYLKSLEEEKVRVADLLADMELDDQEYLLTKLNGIGFLCDVLYGYVKDATDKLHKYFPDSTLVFYDKLVELQKELKMHIKHVVGDTTEKNETYFCEQSDKVTNYTDKVVKSFMKKQKKLKEKAKH